MRFSFSINSKTQSNQLKRSSAAEADSSTINYVREFRCDESPPPPESNIKPIAPIPNVRRPNKKLKSLSSFARLSQSAGEDAAVHFVLDPGSNPEPGDCSMVYGLNIRHDDSDRHETISDMELRMLREDLVKLPDGPGLEEFEDVPVESFGAALLSGYGWKEGLVVMPRKM